MAKARFAHVDIGLTRDEYRRLARLARQANRSVRQMAMILVVEAMEKRTE